MSFFLRRNRLCSHTIFDQLDAPVSGDIASKHGDNSSCETHKEIEEREGPAIMREEQHVTECQATERGVGTEETDVDDKTTRRANQDRSIGQCCDTRKDKCTCDVDDEDVIGPALAEICLYEDTQQIAADGSEEAASKDSEQTARK